MPSHRLLKELSDLEKNKVDGIKLEVLDDKLNVLQGYIIGSPDSPFAGGVFKIEIIIPDNYPFYPPKMRFITRVWHPNISSKTGFICLDILDKKWAAALTLRVLLMSIQVMLCEPNPNDPQDAVVAKQLTRDYDMYAKTAQYWTYYYANGSNYDEELVVKQKSMTDMGFDTENSLNALSSFDWDVQKATEFLLR